ncbi:MAG: hypothetical protein ABSB74_12730 [Tepidisphaeraceae bacterium]
MRRAIGIIVLALFLPDVCTAAESRISVPLRKGCLTVAQLQEALEEDLHLPPTAMAFLPTMNVAVDLRSINDWLLVRGLNSAMGDGFHAGVTDQGLLVRFDADKLPRDWNQSCDALGRFTEVAAPEAVARQNRRFGLHLPPVVDPHRPLVILIHGLDGDRACCEDLAKLLNGDGFQTAFFVYPSERPLAQSADLFARPMRLLHEQFPSLQIDLVTESMGGLVARKYVEGPEYAGGVDHFIMIAPPNAGSTWTPFSFLLKLRMNIWKWGHDPEWSPAWMIMEGICQAGDDLRPESKFLADLNSQPRRAGVRYTIIAGERPVQYRFAAELLDGSGELIGEGIARWWGVRQLKSAASDESRWLLGQVGDDDGPVSLFSTRLAGVTDFNAMAADHVALYECIDGQPPAAWPVVRDRLSK